MGIGVQRHAPAALSPRKSPDTHSTEAGWASGPDWTGTEKGENLMPDRGLSSGPLNT